MERVKAIDNVGCGKCLILAEKNGIGLIASPEKEEVIVAYMDKLEKGLWHSGTYYRDFDAALFDYEERTK